MEILKLGELKKRVQARILRVSSSEAFTSRLLEMGFLEGSIVEIIHEAPGGDPVAVRVRGSVVALRRSEANAIEVALV